MAKFKLMHIPSGKDCGIDGEVIWYESREVAQAVIDSDLAGFEENYKIVEIL